MTVTVKPKNQFPTAADDVATTTVGTPITINVLANDSDPDGDPLTVEMYGEPDYGSVVVEKDGTIRYTPAPGYVGTDYFNYRISDGTNGYDYASVAVTVTASGENSAPLAHDDRYSVRPNTTLQVAADRGLLANDADADGDPLYVTMFDGPQHGKLKFDFDGSFTYTPDADFSGTDSFTYAASDGLGDSAPVTVTIDVADPTAINAITAVGGGGVSSVCWSAWLPNSYVPSDRVVPSCIVDVPRRPTERA